MLILRATVHRRLASSMALSPEVESKLSIERRNSLKVIPLSEAQWDLNPWSHLHRVGEREQPPRVGNAVLRSWPRSSTSETVFSVHLLSAHDTSCRNCPED